MIMKYKKMETLKARAYDLLATIESCQRELQLVNNEIMRLHNEPKNEVLEEDVVVEEKQMEEKNCECEGDTCKCETNTK